MNIDGLKRNFILIFMGFALTQCSLPQKNLPKVPERAVASNDLIRVQIIGADDRQPEEDFGKAENLEAQKILGLREIKKSITAVVPVECFFTEKDGVSYKYQFNGSLVCNKRTLMINAHSLRKALCEDTKNNFVCRIPKTSKYDEIFIKKPKLSQIKMKDLCSGIEIPSSDDIAIVTLYDPAYRKPLKIGSVESFDLIKNRPFVDVAWNISENYSGKTEKTFMVNQFRELEESSSAKSDMDSGPGSSGSVQLIKQNGQLLMIGLHVGGYGYDDNNGGLKDGRPYSSRYNYTQSVFFNEEVLDFLAKNISHLNKCIREVRPANETTL